MDTFSDILYTLYICCDISENTLILFIIGTVIGYNVAYARKIAFGSMPNLNNYGNIFLKCYVFVAISQHRIGSLCSYFVQ